MKETQPFVLDTPQGVRLKGFVHTPTQDGPRPTAVICHGFKGFMEWGFFPPLAELLSDRGFTVLRFNFSGSGMQPGDQLVTDLDAFRRSTFSQELGEILNVLAAAGKELAPGRVDRRRLALVGHSRGGGGAVLAAASEAGQELAALVTWAAVSTFDRFGEAAAESWQRGEVIEIENGRTGQKLPLGLDLWDDLQNHREVIDIMAAASRLRAPWLIVHGEEDPVVAAAEARQLASAATGEHDLLVIPGADHTFGAKHPFVGPTPALIQALNATQSWLLKHLR